MDPNLSNPNDPVTPTANVVVPPVVAEPVASELPPLSPTQSILQEPQILQTQPPIQNTPPPAPIANPISQNQPPAPPADTSFDGLPKKHIISKKIAATVLVLFLAVTIPLTVFVANQQQNTKSGAANNPEVIERFMNQDITKDQLETVAEEQYAPNAVDSQALKDALDTQLERMVLDKEAADKNIIPSDSEIQAKIDNDGLSEKEARYAVLRDKVTETEVKSWQVYTIGFWAPDNSDTTLSSDEQAVRAQVLAMGPTLINEAKTRLSNKESAYDIAKSLLSKYPNFEGQLAVNGFQISSDSTSTPDYENPILVTHDTSLIGNPFYDTIYSMTGADVDTAKINNPGNGGGEDAIKLVSFNNASFDTYIDWLASKENTKLSVNPL